MIRLLNESSLKYISRESWNGCETLVAETETGDWVFTFCADLYYDSESDEPSDMSVSVYEKQSGYRNTYFLDLADPDEYEAVAKSILDQLNTYITPKTKTSDIDSIMHRIGLKTIREIAYG
jgi:hypothetical protein